MSEQIFAVIDERSPVCSKVVEIFGSRRLPLVDAVLHRADGPDISNALFFKVDWKKLDQRQIERWAEWMAERFHISVGSVLKDLHGSTGMPLLESHVLMLEPHGTEIIRPRPVAQLPNGPIDMRFFH